MGKKKMDEENHNELRRKNIFFHCKDPWELGHRLMKIQISLHKSALRQ